VVPAGGVRKMKDGDKPAKTWNLSEKKTRKGKELKGHVSSKCQRTWVQSPALSTTIIIIIIPKRTLKESWSLLCLLECPQEKNR
jgi:hypothetical protein